MRINNNISAMNTSRQLGNVSGRLSRSMEKLSSGLRIARAADDAAGLAVSEKLRGQIRGVNAAVRAQQDSVSGLQVAEGALNEVSSMLTRAKELTIQRSGTSDSDAISAIDAELSQVFNEIDNIEENTEYNGNKLLKGSGAFSIYTDINGTTSSLTITSLNLVATDVDAADDTATSTDGLFRVTSGGIELFNSAGNADVSNITGGNGLVYSDIALDDTDGGTNEATGATTGAGEAISEDYITEAEANGVTAGSYNTGLKSAIDSAINTVATRRGEIGSYQNRFEASIRNFEGTAENLQAAESRIRDVDMAKEMVGFTKDTIIQQAAQAMLVQANQLPQNIVGLLR
jgi:flagellin